MSPKPNTSWLARVPAPSPCLVLGQVMFTGMVPARVMHGVRAVAQVVLSAAGREVAMPTEMATAMGLPFARGQVQAMRSTTARAWATPGERAAGTGMRFAPAWAKATPIGSTVAMARRCAMGQAMATLCILG